MRRKSYIAILILVLAFIVSTVLPLDALAKRGGGRRSGGGSRRSASKSWGAKKKSTTNKSWSKSNKKTAKSSTGGSKTDRALYRKAKQSGKVFKTRDAAKKDFMSKYGDQYSTKFPNKPSTRPDYVPQNTTLGDGRKVAVDYYPQHGGYGYMQDGRFRLYNALGDVAMLSLLMRNHNYYYGPRPMMSGFGRGFMVLGGVALLIFGFVIYSRYRKSEL
ncbi:hypothetical protein K8I28_07035 [bacterium]|nr:hypothetical protein [bacterium]